MSLNQLKIIMALATVNNKLTQLEVIRNRGKFDSVNLGFNSFNDNNQLLFSRGVPVYIGGEPHHGKSTITKELIMHLMQNHDFKVFGYFGEDGYGEDIIAEFSEVYIGMKYPKLQPNGSIDNYAMTDAQKDEAHAFLSTRLFICELLDDEVFTMEYFYSDLDKAEEQLGFKFDSAVIDPIYDVEGFEAKEKMINKILSKFNKKCQKSKRVDILVNHVGEAYTIYDKERREYIRKPARSDQWLGGKNNARRAYLQLLIFRPMPIAVPMEHEELILDNESWLFVQKAKPKGIARIGKIKLYFDWKKNRYYEESPVGNGKNYALGTNFGEVKDPKIDIKEIKPSLTEALGETEEKKESDNFPF